MARDRRFPAPAPVTRGTGLRAGALGADLGYAARVEPGDTATAGSDRYDVEDVDPGVERPERGLLGHRHLEAGEHRGVEARDGQDDSCETEDKRSENSHFA